MDERPRIERECGVERAAAYFAQMVSRRKRDRALEDAWRKMVASLVVAAPLIVDEGRLTAGEASRARTPRFEQRGHFTAARVHGEPGA